MTRRSGHLKVGDRVSRQMEQLMQRYQGGDQDGSVQAAESRPVCLEQSVGKEGSDVAKRATIGSLDSTEIQRKPIIAFQQKMTSLKNTTKRETRYEAVAVVRPGDDAAWRRGCVEVKLKDGV